MKKITLTLLVMLISTFAFSQNKQKQGGGERQSIEQRQAKEIKQLTKTLELDEAQVKSIKVLQADFAEKIEEKKSSFDSSDRSAMREEMKTLRDTYNKDVRALLNEEQQKKFDSYLEDQKNNQNSERQGGKGQGRNGGGGGGNRM